MTGARPPTWTDITLYPDACYITGHCTTEYADIMKRHPNLFVCSCPLLGPRACEEVVAAIGSDLQDLPIAWGLGPILLARIAPEQKRLILGGTLERILRTWTPPSPPGGEGASPPRLASP